MKKVRATLVVLLLTVAAMASMNPMQEQVISAGQAETSETVKCIPAIYQAETAPVLTAIYTPEIMPLPTASQLPEKAFKTVTTTPDPEPTLSVPAHEFNKKDKEYIARVVYAEARGECFEGQMAVAQVVINRYLSGKFGKTVKKVVYAPHQFAVGKRYSDENMRAVEAAIADMPHPDTMFYFQVSKRKEWRNFEYYRRIGNHSFYLVGE